MRFQLAKRRLANRANNSVFHLATGLQQEASDENTDREHNERKQAKLGDFGLHSAASLHPVRDCPVRC